MNDWYISSVSQEQIVEAKKIVQEANNLAWSNKFESDTRWIGYLGEQIFKEWLDKTKIPYHYWRESETKDIRDFTVGRLEIDVKAVGTNFFPQNNYGCQVVCSQLGNENVNAYVFCRYLLKENKVVIMGWLPKDEFLEISRLCKAGEQVTKSFKVPADMREVKLYQLKPLIDLDRYR